MSIKDIQQYAINKSSFDANVNSGLASSKVQDDTTVYRFSIDSGLASSKVQDDTSNYTELPMVNMSHDKFCSAIQGTCLGLSGMCGFPDASGKYKKEYADDEKKVKCSDLRPSCDFFAGYCDSKIR